MTNRTVEEIQIELKQCRSEAVAFRKEMFCYETMHWRDAAAATVLNKMYDHIRNLEYELNRAKQRDWANRASFGRHYNY